MKPRHESPVRRVNPSGQVVWIARYTDPSGHRVSAGTFALRREAQEAIIQAYGRRTSRGTLAAYLATWTRHHPRSDRTNTTNVGRIRQVLDVPVDGRPLGDWPLHELRRRHALELVDWMLTRQGRAATGAAGILRALSAMSEDAITDEVADANPFRGVRVRHTDPRVTKPRRALRVWSFEEMHAFAAAASTVSVIGGRRVLVPAPGFEALLRVPADTGMRLGEFLALRRRDLAGGVFTVRQTTHEGAIRQGTKTDEDGRRVPCPPGLAALIRAMPPRIDTDLLFPAACGRVWRDSNFRRQVWSPTQEASGMDIRPHEMRHSWITHLRAAGVDDADLAAAAGHSIAVMHATYAHSLGRSFDVIRGAVG